MSATARRASECACPGCQRKRPRGRPRIYGPKRERSPILMAEPTLREQNLIGNVLAHIAVEREAQKGWKMRRGAFGEENEIIMWWGP